MNNYNPAKVLVIGQAHDLVLGIKPVMFCCDSEGGIYYFEFIADVDEIDE
jgi:hypothetical protein